MRLSYHALHWRWRARRFRRAPRLPAVLVYHSVSARRRDPLHLALPPEAFAAHLTWLSRHTTALALADFAARLLDGTLPANAVALTFDDGYADNVETAEPLLRRRGIPATVFVATDYIGSDVEGWWDELDAMFLETPRLPARFQHDGFACTVEPTLDQARAGWSVLSAPGTDRERAFVAASRYARSLTRDHRGRFIASLRTWCGRAPGARPGCVFATWSALRAADRGGVLSVGAHTRSHPALATLAPDEQRDEIAGSDTVIRTEMSREPTGFAYPFGTFHDFSPLTRRLVAASGAAFACANMTAHLRPGRADRWQLPRVLIGNWTVAELAARLGA
jgi:peptidoglycan/xylan/chitin deacetylase (PgdA/CDA1 family)